MVKNSTLQRSQAEGGEQAHICECSDGPDGIGRQYINNVGFKNDENTNHPFQGR